MAIAKYELTEEVEKEIERLEKQNEHPDISASKKQENEWRIQTYRKLGRKKPSYEPVAEENKLYPLDYRLHYPITPNDLLEG
ncbi:MULTISPECIES: hypothetical protein [Bacillus]|uniref:Uncharacterized protein n=1 Tax=Bacillus cereus TaxID=1396 RepID=A0A164L283_BACCE|nr:MULTISPECIES: hypothetical protein [Bacillus]KZD53960.1 hypothetical protein B4088_5722 [Bacillus cereus]TSI05004.1 hypothetical protein FOT98_28255 [Bacillus sp. HY001]